MPTFSSITLFSTLLFSGLIAGLLYSYSCSVNIGLKALPDDAYVKAMQSINRAIQNPYFFVCFVGLLLLFPISAWQSYGRVPLTSFYLLLAAALLYFIGVFGVTVFGNVPLNNQLAQFDISKASSGEISIMRTAFEAPWNKYHFLRTAVAVLSFGLTIAALFKIK